MASKREEQMAARYAEMAERNKQLEQQNADYAAEIERLRKNAVDNSCAALTKDDIRQIFQETLASEKEILDKTSMVVRAVNLNVRNACEYFQILSDDEHFKNFSQEVGFFREQALDVMQAVSRGCKEMSDASTLKVTPDYRQAVSDLADEVTDQMGKKLVDATDEALNKVKEGSKCTVLTPDEATFLSYVWLVTVIGFIFSLFYNHCFLHAFGLFVIQYICLGIVMVPWLIAIVAMLFLGFFKRK